MQRHARDRILAKRFATRKQEVQSLYLSGFDGRQIGDLTGIHRRNISKYVTEKSVPRAVPRPLQKDEMQFAVTAVGEPRYSFCVQPPLSVTTGMANVLFTAQDALNARQYKLDFMGISQAEQVEMIGQSTSVDEDVEHYYDRVWKRLKGGNTDGSD
jgi:hypothetical protein